MARLTRRMWVGAFVALGGVGTAALVVHRLVVAGPIVECRISLGLTNSNGRVEVLINNAERLKELLDKPLRAAVINKNPARYPILGSVKFKREDGSEGGFTLFDGWVHLKQDERYLEADLRPLMEYVKKILRGQADRMR